MSLPEAREAFLRIAEADTGGRAEALADLDRTDPAAAQHVRELLDAHDGRGPLDELLTTIGSMRPDRGPSPDGFHDRYRILRELGRGAMGVVELAHDQILDRLVALKRLTLPAELSELQERRVLREARAAARLSHPSIATVYAVETDPEGRTVLVMEHCAGESLAARLERGPVPPTEALRIVRDLAAALAAAHGEGIIHRDVKPTNIMLAEDGAVHLVDFGIAVAGIARGSSAPRGAAGTEGYMSPEQLRGGTLDGRSDLWSLGVVLHEMLYATRPPREPSRPAMGGRLAGGAFDARIDGILERLLADDPTDRYRDAAALLGDLDSLARPEGRLDRGRITAPPATLDGFIGREADVGSVKRALSDSRLVTLVGPGGVGKTRLALEVARQDWATKPPLAAFVELSSVHDAAIVPAAIASALGVRPPAGKPVLEAVQNAVADQELLLVLDNFEHVVDATEHVLLLLQRCPGLRILVTSQERLRLRGECDVQVEPLACSRPDDPEASGVPAAARLFIERAPGLSTPSALSPDQRARVEAICAAVGGLPLGIELAAAASRAQTLEEIQEGLARTPRAIGDDARDRPDRHRTLDATVRWSLHLLSPDLRETLLELSTFAGGFTVDAAARICDRSPNELAEDLERLERRSLLRRMAVSRGESSFGFLRPVRALVEEERDRKLDSGRLADRHLAYFSSLAEEAGRHLQGPEQIAWLDRLERSAADLHAAMQHAMHGGDIQLGASLMRRAWRFWLARGRLAEGRQLVGALLATSDGPVAGERAELLEVLATFERNSGSEAQATEHLRESLAMLRETGDEAGEARLLNQLSWAHVLLGELREAEGLALHALDVSTKLDLPRGVALANNNLGWVANFRDRGAEGIHYHARSLEIVRSAGDPRAVVFGLCNLAWSHLIHRQVPDAERCLDEAETLWREVRDPLLRGWVLTVQGLRLAAEGRAEEAIDSLTQAVRAGKRFEVGAHLAWTLVALGSTQEESGRVLGAAETFERILRADGLGSSWAVARAREGLGRIHLSSGHREAARHELEQALTLWTRIGNEPRRLGCEVALGRL